MTTDLCPPPSVFFVTFVVVDEAMNVLYAAPDALLPTREDTTLAVNLY
ncbi:MAG: hypothetical protein AB9869_26890 [Verrucomicrobiia bacterium]